MVLNLLLIHAYSTLGQDDSEYQLHTSCIASLMLGDGACSQHIRRSTGNDVYDTECCAEHAHISRIFIT